MLFLAKGEAVNRINAPTLLSVPAHPQEFPASRSRCSTSQDTGDTTVEKHRLMGMKSTVRLSNEQQLEVFQCGEQERTWPHLHEGQLRPQLKHLWQPLSRAEESPEPRCACRVVVCGGGRGGGGSAGHNTSTWSCCLTDSIDSAETTSLIWSTSSWFRF